MSSKSVVFIAFLDQPNLGIGYMASILRQHGYSVDVLDVRSGPQPILARVRELDPLIIGFSVIFQYYTEEFARLCSCLRTCGVTSMICAGGHYPSLECQGALEAMPGLDCIVRFEGEQTLVELAHRLSQGQDWKGLEGLAYREDGGIVSTPLRPLVADLDSLPFPLRSSFDYACLGVRATSLLASRGCPRACSFCSIRRFYSIPPGKVRRTRSPENVLTEMNQLYGEHNVRIFLFQDDDFSLMSARDRQWAAAFLDGLSRSPLAGKIIWKISCRADEVEPGIFAAFRTAGLYLVYLGIESGNPVGLSGLNKGITVAQNLRAVETLKKLGIHYDFGFMLFDPSSAVDTVLENVRFLRRICGDGSATASFGKTLPYAGTDLEQQMRAEGRLRGDVTRPDYSFLNPRTERWFAYLCEVFHPWVYGGDSLQSQLRWAQFERDVAEHFYPDAPGLADHGRRLDFLVGWYNNIFCRIVEDSAEVFKAGLLSVDPALASIRSAAERQRAWVEEQLARQRHQFFTRSGIPLGTVLGGAQPAA
ncbi:MAG TPA: radical SAM protein [Thermoanaerobaculaceae bacterium]|nr:radical SAM protein [Thermoanaerobaculaceae bacterium]